MLESFWLWIVGLATMLLVLLTLLAASRNHKQQRRAFFEQQVPVDGPTRRRLVQFVGADGAVASTVSVFDVLYHMWQIDPQVLRGINHLHHRLEFDNLHELMHYIQQNILHGGGDGPAFEAAVHKYKGYTGEQVVFDELAHDGENVTMAESPTQPGYDMTVDDKPYNVKTTLDPAYVRDHLRSDPDNDVIVPEEVGERFHDQPRVRVQEGFSHDATESATADTLEVIGDDSVGEWFAGLPLVTLVASSCRGYSRVRSGQLDISTAVEHAAADTAGRGLGRWAGASVGLHLGLILAPATGGLSAIVLPAGGSLLGVLMGAFAGGQLSQLFKGRHLRKATDRLREQAQAFRHAFLQRCPLVIDTPLRFYNQLVDEAERQISTRDGWLMRRWFPAKATVFFQLARQRARHERERWLVYYRQLTTRMAKQDPAGAGMLLYAQGSLILQKDPVLLEHYSAVTQGIEEVEAERRKLT